MLRNAQGRSGFCFSNFGLVQPAATECAPPGPVTPDSGTQHPGERLFEKETNESATSASYGSCTHPNFTATCTIPSLSGKQELRKRHPSDAYLEGDLSMTQGKKQYLLKLNLVRRSMAAILLCLLIPVLGRAGGDDKEQERVKTSGEVLKELLNGPSGVPLSVLNKAECVI